MKKKSCQHTMHELYLYKAKQKHLSAGVVVIIWSNSRNGKYDNNNNIILN